MDLVGTLTKLATESGLEREVRMRHGLRTVGAGLVAACAILLLGQRTAQGLADSSRSAAPVLGVATLGAAALNDDTPSAVPVSPARLLDTRPGQPTIDGVGYQGLMAAGQSTIVPVAGRAGVPNTGIDAVVVNITAITPSGGRTWLTVTMVIDDD